MHVDVNVHVNVHLNVDVDVDGNIYIKQRSILYLLRVTHEYNINQPRRNDWCVVTGGRQAGREGGRPADFRFCVYGRLTAMAMYSRDGAVYVDQRV